LLVIDDGSTDETDLMEEAGENIYAVAGKRINVVGGITGKVSQQ
jgi:glycosyltransferase involved in cell wall biosynthesis